jgi:hypothetical protein
MTAAVETIRRRLALYAATTLVGIVWSVVADSTVGGVITLGSLTMLIWTLHRFGRTGPD